LPCGDETLGFKAFQECFEALRISQRRNIYIGRPVNGPLCSTSKMPRIMALRTQILGPLNSNLPQSLPLICLRNFDCAWLGMVLKEDNGLSFSISLSLERELRFLRMIIMARDAALSLLSLNEEEDRRSAGALYQGTESLEESGGRREPMKKEAGGVWEMPIPAWSSPGTKSNQSISILNLYHTFVIVFQIAHLDGLQSVLPILLEQYLASIHNDNSGLTDIRQSTVTVIAPACALLLSSSLSSSTFQPPNRNKK
ncbi:hypothetical protein KCU90_g119, partial [Aureobasidium melanogenum]